MNAPRVSHERHCGRVMIVQKRSGRSRSATSRPVVMATKMSERKSAASPNAFALPPDSTSTGATSRKMPVPIAFVTR